MLASMHGKDPIDSFQALIHVNLGPRVLHSPSYRKGKMQGLPVTLLHSRKHKYFRNRVYKKKMELGKLRVAENGPPLFIVR